MGNQETVTVITEDSSYDLGANGWTIHGDNQLDVTTDDDRVVASFSPARWIAVFTAKDQIEP